MDQRRFVGVYRQPIIGWRITAYGPEAIVLDDDSDVENMESGFIKYPDGQVFGLDCTWENEAHWLDATKTDALARKAKG